MLKILRCQNLLFYVPRRYYAKKDKQNPIEMKYLNVAEKNDAAKMIAGQLSRGKANRVN